MSKALRSNSPDLWGRLLEMQADTTISFTSRATLFDLDERFANEELKSAPPLCMTEASMFDNACENFTPPTNGGRTEKGV